MFLDFAPEYERVWSEEFQMDVIQFPADTELRRELLPFSLDNEQGVKHPAKNNLHMLKALVECYCPEGGIVCDPMAGTGSSMIATTVNRKVKLIELEPRYFDICMSNRNHLTDIESAEWFDSELIEGECVEMFKRFFISDNIDLIMFSPPYSNQLKATSTMATYGGRGSDGWGTATFTAHPDNLSVLTEFRFNAQMQEVYKECFRVLKPGGYMAVIIKDQISQGKRVYYGVHHMKMCSRLGFEVVANHKREAIGAFLGRFNKSRGFRQVEDEDMLIFRRPG